jgi:hypothetical protein
VPVYDYERKFNYPHYLRDDKVPAFISTKHNQLKKELDVDASLNVQDSKSNIMIPIPMTKINSHPG